MLIQRFALTAALLAAAGAAHAQVAVADAWARATVPGQHATGIFMTLTAERDSRLVAADSPAAKHTEIHEMTNENDVMKMRQIEGVDLPAGQAVELRPGGYHLMLMGLHEQAREGTELPVSLTFRDAQGEESVMELTVPVRPLNAPAGGHKGHHGH